MFCFVSLTKQSTEKTFDNGEIKILMNGENLTIYNARVRLNLAQYTTKIPITQTLLFIWYLARNHL